MQIEIITREKTGVARKRDYLQDGTFFKRVEEIGSRSQVKGLAFESSMASSAITRRGH